MQTKNLKELCSTITKGTTPTSLGMKLNEGDINFIKVECLSEDGNVILEKMQKIDEVTHNKLNRSKLEVGDILYSIAGSIGRMAVVDDSILPANTNQAVAILRPIKDQINPQYLYYFLRDKKSQQNAKRRIVQSVQTNLSLGELSSLEVAIPSSAEQAAIGNFMKTLDDKIATNLLLSRTLEELAQTIFKSWFIDFDPVRMKMAGEMPVGMDSSIATFFPNSLEESELGQIPQGWKVSPLFECGLEIESGSRPKGGVKGISSGIPSIGAESINGLGVFDFAKTKYVPLDFYEKMNKGKPQDFDILLYKDGGKPGEFKPRVGMFGLGFPFTEYVVNEHVFILRSEEIGNPYLYFWIRLERTLDILRNRGVKAAIPGINQQDVGTIPTLQPPKELLNAFNELAMPIISMILTLAKESHTIANLRDAILPRLISGELEVPREMLVP